MTVGEKAALREFDLEAIRTDGWFERIGEGIGSFQALCEIVGERFFAFSVIVGARITALTVDRRNPDLSLVDFAVGGRELDEAGDTQRLTLADFRRRLVGALLVDDEKEVPVPTRDTDVEGIQLFIGVRYLLLAPLYGFSLRKLKMGSEEGTRLVVLHDGIEEIHDLGGFRLRVRALVREELDRIASGSRGAIDLSKVTEAEGAAHRGEWEKVVQLLGTWPAPLAIFLRTPEGQALTPDARALIAKGLGLLGSACVALEELPQAEEVFRIGIQYAQEGAPAADLFLRLGKALLQNDRPGEAIGPLRRALAFAEKRAEVLPFLARALLRRNKWVAAHACLREALAAGANKADLSEDLELIESTLGAPLEALKALSGPPEALGGVR